MKKKNQNFRFNYDEFTQKFVFEDSSTPFSVREFLDQVVLCTLFTLNSFHVLQLNTGLYQFRIVHHKDGNYPYDCFVTSL